MITKELIEKYKSSKKETALLSVLIDSEDMDQIDGLADQNELKRSDIVRIILKNALYSGEV